MTKPIPSPFSPTPIEDEVYLALEELADDLGIDAFFFMYAQTENEKQTIWKCTSSHQDEFIVEKLREAADNLEEGLEEEMA